MKAVKYRTKLFLKIDVGGSKTFDGSNVYKKVMCHRLEIVILPPSLIMLSMYLAVKITRKTC
jgi:hypothetical protein